MATMTCNKRRSKAAPRIGAFSRPSGVAERDGGKPGSRFT